MILQTGQRTDIPAFYAPWFINRVRAGFVDVRNPYHRQHVTRYMINPDVVDGIAFCTKNPRPMIPFLPVIREYRQYWHMTVTPYGRDLEPSVPPYAQVIEDFKLIGSGLNPRSMVWRYDPVIINHTYTFDIHCESFYTMAKSLSGYTDTVVVSFLDIFDKVLDNYPEAERPSHDMQEMLLKEFLRIARQFRMNLKTCGEGHRWDGLGIDTGGCLTVDCYERAWDVTLNVPKRSPSRPECACYLHGDIGAYDSCSHFCRYCYANTNQQAVYRNRAFHDPNSSFLIGHSLPDDILTVQDAGSWIIETPPKQDSFLF